MGIGLKIFKSRYPDSFRVEAVRMSVIYDENDTEPFQLHVIPLVKSMMIGDTIYHGYEGQNLQVAVADLMKIHKEVTAEKDEGIWYLYCLREDAVKAKLMLQEEVEKDLHKPLQLS